MSTEKIGLKKTMTQTLIWLIILPFFATWPIVSLFPLFGLVNSSSFGISTLLNIIFFVFGFWPLALLLFAAFALMYSDVRTQKYKTLRRLGPWIGVYAILWNGLYLIAIFASH